MGDGESIWLSDPCLPKPHSFKPRLWAGARDMKVSELITEDTKQWKMNMVSDLVVPEEVDMIQAIPISRSGCPDKRVWHYTKNGRYTVKSGYHVVMEMMKNGEFGRKGGGMPSSQSTKGGPWKTIWELGCRIKFACSFGRLVVKH